MTQYAQNLREMYQKRRKQGRKIQTQDVLKLFADSYSKCKYESQVSYAILSSKLSSLRVSLFAKPSQSQSIKDQKILQLLNQSTLKNSQKKKENIFPSINCRQKKQQQRFERKSHHQQRQATIFSLYSNIKGNRKNQKKSIKQIYELWEKSQLKKRTIIPRQTSSDSS